MLGLPFFSSSSLAESLRRRLRAIARFKLAHRPFDVMFDGFRRDFQIRRGLGSAFRENMLRACLTVWV
jgi:hypothetical protein